MTPQDYPMLRRAVMWTAMTARTLDQCERADRLMMLEWFALGRRDAPAGLAAVAMGPW